MIYSIAEGLQILQDNSDRLFELLKGNILPEFAFGYKDVEGGYGWHPVLQVVLTKCGRKCSRPGCLYDETGTKEDWEKYYRQELERVTSHQHRYIRAERLVLYWDSEHIDTLEDALKYLENDGK